MLCICIDSAVMGQSNSTTAFAKLIQYFSYTMKAYLTYAWRSFGVKKELWQNDIFKNWDKFPCKQYMLIVPLWANQLLP